MPWAIFATGTLFAQGLSFCENFIARELNFYILKTGEDVVRRRAFWVSMTIRVNTYTTCWYIMCHYVIAAATFWDNDKKWIYKSCKYVSKLDNRDFIF
jgi:hypothetical protein